MMKKLLYCLVLCSFISLFSMNRHGRQLLLCAHRKGIETSQVSSTTCSFCDEENLKKNYVVKEDKENDCRIIMNKFPYFDFSQGHQLLIMPISHKTSFAQFSQQELARQLNEAWSVNAKLYADSYSEAFCIHLGENGGQSVPHLHSHIQNFIQKPLSLPDAIQCKNDPNNNMNYALEVVQSKLAQNVERAERNFLCKDEQCYSCSIINTPEDDDKNFVIGRFKHNLVCLAHFPQIAAHIVVIPYHHGHALRDLSMNELLENISLALSVLPKLKGYVQKEIRKWTGDNIIITSLGGKTSDAEKSEYHLYTSVMPRTVIHPSSGTVSGQMSKLDFDPVDLAHFLRKEVYGELQKVSEHGWMNDGMNKK